MRAKEDAVFIVISTRSFRFWASVHPAQHVPGNVQQVPGDVQQVPGDVQRVPGDVQKVPGDVQKVPRDLLEARWRIWFQRIYWQAKSIRRYSQFHKTLPRSSLKMH